MYITIIICIVVICACICFCNYRNNFINYDSVDYIKLQNIKTIAKSIVNTIEEDCENSINTDINEIEKDVKYILSIIDTNDDN